MPNLATLCDYERDVQADRWGNRDWEIPITSTSTEEHDYKNRSWHTQCNTEKPEKPILVVRLKNTEPTWLFPMLERLTHLSKLRENWDSYGAEPISQGSIALAVQLSSEIMTEDTPMPTIVPTTRGGIQFEWHLAGIDLEVEVMSNGILAILNEDNVNEDNSWEDDISFIPGLGASRLRKSLQLLAERAM